MQRLYNIWRNLISDNWIGKLVSNIWQKTEEKSKDIPLLPYTIYRKEGFWQKIQEKFDFKFPIFQHGKKIEMVCYRVIVNVPRFNEQEQIRTLGLTFKLIDLKKRNIGEVYIQLVEDEINEDFIKILRDQIEDFEYDNKVNLKYLSKSYKKPKKHIHA